MKTKFLPLFLFALLSIALDARAQLVWSSYNTSGTRVSASAATYNSATGNYTFTIPANTTYTFLTTGFVPVTLAASQTKTVTFTMTATGGFGPAGTPVQNQRFISYGLFNYGATAPDATGQFTDDVGLWTDSYQQTSGIAPGMFGGTSGAANLLAYQSGKALGSAGGPSTGAVGQFTDNSATNVTFRVVENAGGSASIGTATATNIAGAWYQDAATSGTTFNRTSYSAAATTPSGTTTFNEFGFLFFNSTSSPVTLTLASFTGLTPVFATQPPASTVTTAGSNISIAASAPTATAFQWQKSTDGGATFNNVSGATSATLALTNVQSSDGGAYRVNATTVNGTYASSNATVTVFTSNPNDPSIFIAYKTGTVTSGSTPTSATTTTAAAPGTGWNYSAAAQVTGTTWNQILRPNPQIPSGTLNGTTGTFVCNSANNIGLASATGAATSVKLTMNMVIADLEAGSSTRIEPNTAAGGTGAQGANGLMSNAWRIYRAGNSSTGTISGLTANAHYQLYVYGSTTTTGQGCKYTLNSDNFGSDDVAVKSTAGGNSGNLFNFDGTNYSLSTIGTTWQQFHAVSNNSGNIVITTSINSGNGQYYNGLQLVPYPLPVITAQPPANTTGTTNGSVSLSVTATTSAGTLAYQWQKSTDSGAIFHNIDPYGGNASAGTATLLLANLQSGDAGIYRVLVTNAGGTVISTNASLTVNAGISPPSIATHPANTTVLSGASATLTVVASGTAPFTYQWQKSTDGGATFPTNVGTDSATFTIASTVLSDAGQYRVIVTNSAGSATSNAATLTVNQAPTITTQPVGSIVASGASYILSATFNLGSPAPTYQWQKSTDGVTYSNVSGATSASLALTGSAATSGYYKVTATNAGGSVTSSAVYFGIPSTQSVTFAPGNSATGLSIDQQLRIVFPSAPKLGISGVITIRDAADNSVTATIDRSQFLSYVPGNTSIQVIPNAAIRTVQGSPNGSGNVSSNYYYMPIAIYGNEVWITLGPTQRFSYGHTYYVTMDSALLLDSSNAAFMGVSGSSTWRFSTKTSGPATPTASTGLTTITIGLDGTGDFASFQGAFDWIPQNNTLARTIRVKPGTYRDSATLAQNRNFVTIAGDGTSRTDVQLIYPFAYFAPPSTVFTAGSLRIESSDVTVRDITVDNIIYNEYHPTGSASSGAAGAFAGAINTIATTGKRIVFDNVLIKGGQDTLYTITGITYFYGCEIWGSVDYIYGAALSVFDNCRIVQIRDVGGPVTAPNTLLAQPYGLVFLNCAFPRALTANGYPFNVNVASTTFMRAWGQDGMTSIINCSVDTQFSTKGWLEWAPGDSETTCRALEYGTTLIAGGSVTPSQRQSAGAYWLNTIDPDYTSNPSLISSNALLDGAAGRANRVAVTVNPSDYTLSAMFGNSYFNLSGWMPSLIPRITTQPTSQNVSAGVAVTFSVVATGTPAATYQWYKGNVAISGATAASYTNNSTLPTDTGSYTVVVTNSAGSVTSSAAALTVTDTTPPTIAAPVGGFTPLAIVTGAGGTVALPSYVSQAVTSDNVGVTSVTQSPAAGSAGSVGTVHVTLTASDAAGNTASTSFDVAVADGTPPTITGIFLPLTLVVGAGGTVALPNYAPQAVTTDNVGVTGVTQSPADGSALSLGTTHVTLTVADAAGNTASTGFDVAVLSAAQNWRLANFGTTDNTGDAADNADPDHDGIPNILEFAFGTDPLNASSGPSALQFNGTFADGGTIGAFGQPIARFESTATGIDFRALFVRRGDYASAGLTYVVEFSATLGTWQASIAAPTVLGDDGTMQIVSVPYPIAVGGKKARYFRVRVTSAP